MLNHSSGLKRRNRCRYGGMVIVEDSFQFYHPPVNADARYLYQSNS
jgi:hypothetical protein